jgi:HSP20 family protein
MPRDIWRELMEAETRLDDMFRRFLSPLGGRPYLVTRLYRPATDVYARDGDLVVRFELPGIDPREDVTVTVEAGELVVKGERKEKTEVKEGRYYRLESYYGAFERRLPLPEGVDEGAIAANYENGVLKVVVTGATKKIEPPKPKEIPIKAGATAKS